MEVHHHPQLHHQPKPWKEYLLEGLMIFLAVTMGFFAETIRENISENGRAKELAKSLYDEVYADSVAMQAKIRLRLKKEAELQYFRRYISDSSLTKLSDHFYPSFEWSFIVVTTTLFEPNDGVLNQLRNSGSLRYLKSVGVQNRVSLLNVVISNVRDRNSWEKAFVMEHTRPFILKHFDFKWEDEYSQYGKLTVIQSLSQNNFHSSVPPYIKHLDQFSREDAEGLAAYYLLNIRATRQIFYTAYVKANHQLLQALRKEYHFGEQ